MAGTLSACLLREPRLLPEQIVPSDRSREIVNSIKALLGNRLEPIHFLIPLKFGLDDKAHVLGEKVVVALFDDLLIKNDTPKTRKPAMH